MQSLKCEMCGSNDIIKQEGIYVYNGPLVKTTF